MANRYWLVANCSLTGGMTNDLTWNPHPTEFTPYSEVKTQGTGALRGLGYRPAVGVPDELFRGRRALSASLCQNAHRRMHVGR
jgi:hypothetical protein